MVATKADFQSKIDPLLLEVADVVNTTLDLDTTLRRKPGHAFADLDLHPFGDFAGVSHLETNAQILCFLVDQQNGENLVVDDLADEFGYAPQRGIEVESGVDHVRHLEQQGLDLRLQIGLGGRNIHFSL